MTATGDMYQYHTRHQRFTFLQLLPHLHGIIHMVDVEHHQTVQVAAFQQTPCALLSLAVLGLHRRLIKLIAAELERRERLFQIVSPSQQFLIKRLFLPFLLASLGLQSLQRLEFKFLEVCMFSPFQQRCLVLRIYCMQDFPARVDIEGC